MLYKQLIHSSKVLTDHFSNSLSEKTTNGITIEFSQCNFKSTFYRLPLSNRGICLQIIHVRQKAVCCFTARASSVLTISHFKLDILQDSEHPQKKNRNYCATCNEVMQYTFLNNGCLN